MNITAAMVNDLRAKSGAGIMDCKNALKETEGDLEKAMEVLRKKGAAVAAKRADRSASEGVIYTAVNEDKSSATIIEVNCETDFVGKSDDFLSFAKEMIGKAFSVKANSVEGLNAALPEIPGMINDLVAKVGEKIEISRTETASVEGGLVLDYIHPGNRIAAVVVFANVPADKAETFAKLGRDITIQVAAMKPIAVSRNDVDKALIEKEIEIYREQARNEGKPENVLDRIANGKLEKYYQEACLLEQTFFKEQSNAHTIAQLIEEFNKANGTAIAVQSFILYLLGGSKK